MSSVVPRQVVVGDPTHGVVRYAGQLRDAVALHLGDGSGRAGDGGDGDTDGDGPHRHGTPVHVHFTDKLFGRTPAAAARSFAELARRHPVTVTLHDLPQASDGRRHQARQQAYADVATRARGVVCNSHHEQTLVREGLGVAVRTTVIPLPLVEGPTAQGPARPARAATGPAATVLGFFYPGKGHDDVAQALLAAHSGRPEATGRPRLTVLGAASDGHERDLDRLVAAGASRGLDVHVTGYLPDEALRRHSRRALVPVVAHQHVSASGSLNSWIAAGRRPLVRESGYAREMAALRPGTITTYAGDGLVEALRAAVADPGSTWLRADAVLGPRLPDTAAAYVHWWRDGVTW